MPRFFLEPDRWGRNASLTGSEAHHCARVMRAAPGDRIEVFDGVGRGAEAEVVSVAKTEVVLRLGEDRFEEKNPVRTALAIAALKGKAMDWLIQKAVELGVDELVPLVTERSIVRSDAGSWSRTALEACKQCGRWSLPPVRPLQNFEDFVVRGPEERETRVIASLEAQARPLRETLGSSPGPRQVTFLIGPEGDFSPSETARALDSGWVPGNLGKTVLRSETAALCCLAAARYAFA